MVESEKCKNWFHANCIGIDFRKMEKRSFRCPRCNNNSRIKFLEGWSQHESREITFSDFCNMQFSYWPTSFGFYVVRIVASTDISRINPPLLGDSVGTMGRRVSIFETPNMSKASSTAQALTKTNCLPEKLAGRSCKHQQIAYLFHKTL